MSVARWIGVGVVASAVLAACGSSSSGDGKVDVREESQAPGDGGVSAADGSITQDPDDHASPCDSGVFDSGWWDYDAGSYDGGDWEYDGGPRTGSCVGLCGDRSTDCWCDDYCVSAGDCCTDKAAECPGMYNEYDGGGYYDAGY